jgi:striatin 1/3/4
MPRFVFGSAVEWIRRKLFKAIRMRSGQFAYFPPRWATCSDLNFGGPERLLLVSGSADGTVKVWAVSAPPQSSSPSTGSRRGVGGSRRHSVTSGSNFPSSPQPSVASTTPFTYTLVHSIERPTTGDGKASPTSIAPLSATGENFVVSYTDSSVLIFDTKSGEEIIGMASNETYDGTMGTSINTVVATSMGLEGAGPGLLEASRGIESEEVGAGATGSREGVEGVVITGHEDRFVRFFDANSGKLQLISYMVTGLLLTYSTGQCTYTMLAHPSAISALCLSKDGREAVSAGHDASIRFWSLEKRICTQDIVSHRAMRGEGVCDVCWSSDGRLVVSAGGDGVVKVFAR